MDRFGQHRRDLLCSAVTVISGAVTATLQLIPGHRAITTNPEIRFTCVQGHGTTRPTRRHPAPWSPSQTLYISCVAKKEFTTLRLPNLSLSCKVEGSQPDAEITALFSETNVQNNLELANWNPRPYSGASFPDSQSPSTSYIIIGVDNIHSFWSLCTHLKQLHPIGIIPLPKTTCRQGNFHARKSPTR